MPPSVDTAVCALFYGGDVCRLYHARCIGTLRRLAANPRCELRIGCNDLTAETTLSDVRELAGTLGPRCRVSEGSNIWKYPRMREMFNLAPLPQHVMWWDDDSYLDPSITDGSQWLDAVLADAAPDAQLGFAARAAWRGAQRLAALNAPWSTGRPLLETKDSRGRLAAQFITGGWWVAPGALLQNWPPPDMVHQGGDVMLSQMLHQAGCRLVPWQAGVRVNADISGRNHAAPTRNKPSLSAYGVASCPTYAAPPTRQKPI